MDNVNFTVKKPCQLYNLLNSQLVFFYIIGSKNEFFRTFKEDLTGDNEDILLCLFDNMTGSCTDIIFLKIVYPFCTHYDQVDRSSIGEFNNGTHHLALFDHRLTGM